MCKWISSIFFFLFFFTSIYAEEQICFSCTSKKIEDNSNNACLDNQKIDCCCKRLDTTCQTIDSTIILKPAKGCLCNCMGPYMNVSGLLWQSKEGNLEYAAKNKVTDPSDTNHHEKVEVGIPDFGWRPGVKVEMGYLTKYDSWDTRGIWTYYRGEFTHVKKHSNVELVPENNGVIPLYFFSYFNAKTTPPVRFEHATGDWMMHFNSIDVELARNFFIRRKFSFRLLFGLKAAWINHDYKLYYTDGNRVTSPDDDLTFEKSIIHFKNNSLGVGPRIGFESKCHLIWDIKLLANASLCSLYTNFDVKRDQDDTVYDHLTSEVQYKKIKLKDDFSLTKPNLQLLLGFEWGKCFSNAVAFAISLAYEMQYFWGQNQIRRFVDNNNIGQTYSNKGDLQMQGLTASLKFEF